MRAYIPTRATTYTHKCENIDYVSIACCTRTGDEIKEGDIRLISGQYLWQGRVEIFLSGVWGTVSHDEASFPDADVVCRQLGYNTDGTT